ncbi:pilus assembly protein PilY [Geomonas sp. Red276]
MSVQNVYLKRLSLVMVSLSLALVISTAVMAAISQTPLFLMTGDKPNIFFVLDNSGSMWNISWHPNYPASASAATYPAWFDKFFNGSGDNFVLRQDTTINRRVLYFKSNAWSGGTGSNNAADFTNFAASTPLPPVGQSYVLNATQNTGNYDRVMIADANNTFWITPYNFSSGDATLGTSNSQPIYWNSSSKTYRIINSANGTAGTTKPVGVALPRSADAGPSNDYNTWFTGSYLNWLYFVADATTRSQVAETSAYAQYHTTRIHAAKDAITTAINSTLNADGSSKYRWAGFTYTTATNAAPPRLGVTTWVDPDSAVNITALKTAIAGVWPTMGTPLGGTLQMLWQYVWQSTTNSPVTSRCQSQYLIVVTDGYPHQLDDAGTMASPDPSGSLSVKNSDYWYNPAFPGDNNWRSKAHIVTQRMHLGFAKTFSGTSYTIPIDTFVIGLSFPANPATSLITDPSSMLYLMANNGGGDAYGVSDSVGLINALSATINTIASRISSVSSVAVNTAYVTSSTKLYRAKFNSGDWIGYLEAYGINPATGAVVGYPNTPLWEASSSTPNAASGTGGLNGRAPSSRAIYTAGNDGFGKIRSRYDFSGTNVATLAGSAFMNFSSAATYTSASPAWQLIDYVRGTDIAGYRPRVSKLGDTIYSQPVVIGPPTGFYNDHHYADFKASNRARKSLLYIGANDGMLHAFDADTGNEEWAFIPNMLLPKLKYLRLTPYNHTNYVDGTVTVLDAYIDPTGGDNLAARSWRSVMVCGLREGGKGWFALDVTDPANPQPLWEVNTGSQEKVGNTTVGMGYSFGTPLILKLKTGTGPEDFRWVAALPNGYESGTTGKSASLMLVDLGTGAVLKEIVVDTTTNSASYANGLASPSAIDVNGDGFADYIYAGDLKGNLWKFDVSGAGPSAWDVSYRATGSGHPAVPLFKAQVGSPATPQPITVAPEIVLRGDYQIVYIGTGKYYEPGDATATQTQSLYGIYDKNTVSNNPPAAGLLTRSNLQVQTLTAVTSALGDQFRTSSDNPLAVTALGWYVDLPTSGERVVSDPVAKSGKIIFTSFIPNTDQCAYGGTSWLIELDIATGGTVPKPVFDVNHDSAINGADVLPPAGGGPAKAPTGSYLGEGLAAAPTIVGTSGGLEYKYITSTTGAINVVLEGSGTNQLGVRSWRQLR